MCFEMILPWKEYIHSDCPRVKATGLRSCSTVRSLQALWRIITVLLGNKNPLSSAAAEYMIRYHEALPWIVTSLIAELENLVLWTACCLIITLCQDLGLQQMTTKSRGTRSRLKTALTLQHIHLWQVRTVHACMEMPRGEWKLSVYEEVSKTRHSLNICSSGGSLASLMKRTAMGASA